MSAVPPSRRSGLALASLVARCGGDTAFAREILSLYPDASARSISTAREALAAGTFESARMAVHSLISTLANVGAEHGADLARQLRAALAAGEMGAVEVALQALVSELALVDREIQEALAALDAPLGDQA